jgi:hypothetical protein
MPFVPVPGVVACAVRATLYDEPIQTDFNFLLDAVASGPAITTIITSLLSYWQVNALPLLPAPYRLVSVYGYDAGEQEGPAADVTPTGNDIGLYNGNAMPANVSLFFNSRVGTRKRGNSGGIYWPCFVESDVTGNVVATAITGSILDMLDGMVGLGAIAEDTQLVAVSKYFNNAERPAGVARPIIGWVCNDQVIDSMRRRLPKRNS